MADDLKWALDSFRDGERDRGYRVAQQYYEGEHRLQFATEKFRSSFGRLFNAFADNLCPACVDSLVDRLEVQGFVSPDATRGGTDSSRDAIEPSDPTAAEAWDIWQRNKMDLRSNEVHRESLLAGDGYVIVEPSPEQEAMIWPQLARQMSVQYDASKPGVVARAAKLWQDDEGYLRLTLYFPDRIERHISRKPRKADTGLGNWKSSDFAPYFYDAGMGTWRAADFSSYDVPSSGADMLGDGSSPNPYGRVPVFHFPNRRIYDYGISELADVVPIQDALNKALMDMLVAMEFGAFRQRWVTGIDVELDPVTNKPKPPPWDPGADRFFLSSNKEVRFGEFGQTDLNQFLAVQESLRSEMARISGTPLHYLMIVSTQGGAFPSGEALKSAEARFTKKLKDRQTAFGNVWEDVMRFAMQIEGNEPPVGVRVEPMWELATSRTEREIIETMLMKQALGVSQEQLLKEIGYDDALIQKMLAVNAAQDAAAAAAQAPQSTNGTAPAGADVAPLGGKDVTRSAKGGERITVPDVRVPPFATPRGA